MTSNNYVNFDRKYKKEGKRFLKYKIIAGIAVFLILLGGIFYAVVYSPLFKITKINADNPLIGDDLVDNLKNYFANQSKLTKFLGSENILIWSGGGLGHFAQNPEVAEIGLKKDYSKRTVEIDVKLRERFGVWCQNEQRTADNEQPASADASAGKQTTNKFCYWFDRNGILFALAPELEGNAINQVEDFSGRNLKLGDSVLDENLSSNLVKIFDVLEKSGLGIRALKLENLNDREIIFNQPETSLPKIYFGLKDDPDFILPAIENLKEVGLSKIEYIDFRVENRGYYKIK